MQEKQIVEQLIEKFNELYGAEGPVSVYFAPGRVNLIGEHTDYNGGHVFPCALTIGTSWQSEKDQTASFVFTL